MKKKTRTKYYKFYPTLIFISILFMSIGYAVINSVTLNIEGEALAYLSNKIHITEISYYDNISADTTLSTIKNITDTIINSQIVLSPTDSNSSITYKVTIYNPTQKSYYYNDIIYEIGTETYDNEGIQVSVSGLEKEEIILPKKYKEFYITYSYKDNILASNNTLNSYILIEYKESLCPGDGRICDLSGHDHHLNVVGATYDTLNEAIVTDGINDYLYIDNFDWQNTNQFTIEFIALLPPQIDSGKGNIFFESSINSNNNYGSFYIDTLEYGDNDFTLAMKYNKGSSKVINHQMANGIIDNNQYRHYTITLNTTNSSKYTSMYLDGISQTITKTTVSNNSITDKTLSNYPLYISSRAGSSYFSKMMLKELRIYKVALTDQEVLSNYNGEIREEDLIASYNFKQ